MIRTGEVVRRYASALHQAAASAGAVKGVGESLDRIAGASAGEPRLARLLLHPRVTGTQKVSLLAAAAGSKAPTLVRRFAELLVKSRRAGLAPAMAAAFRAIAEASAGEVRIGVESAEPLAGESVEALRTRLSALLSSQATLELESGRPVLGGVRLRIGDRIVDGTLGGRLATLHRRLVAGSEA